MHNILCLLCLLCVATEVVCVVLFDDNWLRICSAVILRNKNAQPLLDEDKRIEEKEESEETCEEISDTLEEKVAC